MDRELLKEISLISEFNEDVNMGSFCVQLLFTGMNGVYACIDNVTDDAYGIQVYEAIRKSLGLRDGQLFLFRVSDTDEGSFYDYINGFVAMENVYEAYENCYANHLIPQAELFHIQIETPADYCKRISYTVASDVYEEDAESYIAPIISEKQIESIEKKLVEISQKPVINGRYRTYPDGHMDVRRTLTQSVAGVSTFMETGSAFYPCMDMDGDKFFLLTFLGGWFGLHKFKTGNYLKGLFYALTCGCCGVFYILDLISIILGGYDYTMIHCDNSGGTMEFVKKKFYSRPVQRKKKAVLLLIAALLISVLVVRFIYYPALNWVNIFISEILAETELAEELATMITQ